ncbi:MAG: SCO family protein, partial [Elusimicrobia bacterium]|nr:SCO family protein [Elusimicrobiota bacterium]
MMRRVAVLLLAASALAAAAVEVDEKLGGQVPLNAEVFDEEGRRTALGRLIDRPTILTLNYFSCVGLCNPQLNALVDTLNAIPLRPGRDFKVLTFSFDEHDTPPFARMKRINYLKQLRRPFP